MCYRICLADDLHCTLNFAKRLDELRSETLLASC